ncbi:hypothetical protein A0H81_08303 [Grifola frondosa]|uniref:Uncharacterized protein n=1 Tax=Grifola frondosa TaxID=5627 RepID=A0A1C7M4U6_GRIFR|nr:hypothetical protein A0H81_08303 [Grifola frondosa]
MAALPQWMEATAKSWEAQTGWIGYFILGGVDAAGKLQAYATNTGIDSTGANFEERLARVLRWDKDDIRTKFWEYLADVFKRPMPVADDAMKPLTTVRSQSPPGCSPGETHGPQTVVETTSQQLAHLLTPAPRVASPAIPVPSVVGTSGASPLTPAPPSSTPVLFLHTPTSAIPAPSAATLPIASDGMKKKSRQKAKKSKKSKTSTAADKTAMGELHCLPPPSVFQKANSCVEITQRMNASARVARAKVATTKIAVAKAVAAEVAGAKASRSVESQILRSSRERRPSSRSLGEDPLMTTVARAKRQRTDGIEDASALKKPKPLLHSSRTIVRTLERINPRDRITPTPICKHTQDEQTSAHSCAIGTVHPATAIYGRAIFTRPFFPPWPWNGVRRSGDVSFTFASYRLGTRFLPKPRPPALHPLYQCHKLVLAMPVLRRYPNIVRNQNSHLSATCAPSTLPPLLTPTSKSQYSVALRAKCRAVADPNPPKPPAACPLCWHPNSIFRGMTYQLNRGGWFYFKCGTDGCSYFVYPAQKIPSPVANAAIEDIRLSEVINVECYNAAKKAATEDSKLERAAKKTAKAALMAKSQFEKAEIAAALAKDKLVKAEARREKAREKTEKSLAAQEEADHLIAERLQQALDEEGSHLKRGRAFSDSEDAPPLKKWNSGVWTSSSQTTASSSGRVLPASQSFDLEWLDDLDDVLANHPDSPLVPTPSELPATQERMTSSNQRALSASQSPEPWNTLVSSSGRSDTRPLLAKEQGRAPSPKHLPIVAAPSAPRARPADDDDSVFTSIPRPIGPPVTMNVVCGALFSRKPDRSTPEATSLLPRRGPRCCASCTKHSTAVVSPSKKVTSVFKRSSSPIWISSDSDDDAGLAVKHDAASPEVPPPPFDIFAIPKAAAQKPLPPVPKISAVGGAVKPLDLARSWRALASEKGIPTPVEGKQGAKPAAAEALRFPCFASILALVFRASDDEAHPLEVVARPDPNEDVFVHDNILAPDSGEESGDVDVTPTVKKEAEVGDTDDEEGQDDDEDSEDDASMANGDADSTSDDGSSYTVAIWFWLQPDTEVDYFFLTVPADGYTTMAQHEAMLELFKDHDAVAYEHWDTNTSSWKSRRLSDPLWVHRELRKGMLLQLPHVFQPLDFWEIGMRMECYCRHELSSVGDKGKAHA